MEQLKESNYYSNEMGWQYMSVSQYKDFVECEAAALAKLKGDWEPTSDPVALLVGNYVHSYFESNEAHEKFIEENKSKMYSSRSPYGLLKDFKIAQQMIERLESEPAFQSIYQGDKEVIVTGELFGVQWKGKIDCLNLDEEYFVDIKTTRDIHKRQWNEHYRERATFLENFGYLMQAGVYQELLKQQYDKDFAPVIAAVSKQTPSEARLITLDEDKVHFEMILLKENIDHIQKIKMGEEKPEMCGKCEYCREHQHINGFTHMDEL